MKPKYPTSPNAAGRADDTPELPHERDESSDATGEAERPDMQQARRDVERGLKDTSRHPEADAAYQRQKKPDTSR